MLVLVYLAAIVAANLIVAALGPAAVVWVAFLFIGLDLTVRDALHERWAEHALAPRMGALVVGGSALSWAANPAAGQVALASAVAWGCAAAADAVTYQLLRRHPWWVRVNGSNVAGAAVDSLVFPTMAFGALLPLVVLGQFAAKVAGGALWAGVLGAWRSRRCPVCGWPATHQLVRAEAQRVPIVGCGNPWHYRDPDGARLA